MSSDSTSSNDNHSFIPAKTTDSRSPCPALNALANHGYLPRDGKNLGTWQLVRVLQEVYNLSLPLAFTLSFAGVLRCGRNLSLDLNMLAAHNAIEHDGSLVHGDTPKGSLMAPIAVDTARLHALLAHSSNGQTLSINDFARARLDIEAKLEQPLTFMQSSIAHGEVALVMSVMKSMLVAGAWPLETARQWFEEERLPDGWKKSEKTVGLIQVHPLAQQVAAAMKTHKTE